MCGRFNVTSDPLQEILMDLVGQSYPGSDNHNVAPTAKTWIIRSSSREDDTLEVAEAQWWLVPNWVKEPGTKYAMFNARCENLRKSGAFRMPFEKQRCVLPISGFYEWKRAGNAKLPHYVTPVDRKELLLAGLWDRWTNRESGEILDSFTIVTTDVAESLSFLHNRQPVMLTRSEAREWISLDTPQDRFNEFFDPRIPVPLDVFPVSPYVSNTRNHGPQCVEPTGVTVSLGIS